MLKCLQGAELLKRCVAETEGAVWWLFTRASASVHFGTVSMTRSSIVNHKTLPMHEPHKHAPVRNRSWLPGPGPPDLLHRRSASSLVCNKAIHVARCCQAVQNVQWMAAAIWPQQCTQTLALWSTLHCNSRGWGYCHKAHSYVATAHWLEGRAC